MTIRRFSQADIVRVLVLIALVSAVAVIPSPASANGDCMNCVALGGGSMCSPGPNFGYTDCAVNGSGIGCNPNGGERCNIPI